MRNRKTQFLLLLLAVLLMGCAGEHTENICRQRGQGTPKSGLIPVAEDTHKENTEIKNITESEGPLNLSEVLALTLMNNPELMVFSLETRAAQARQLQAGLWPNPKLKIEVEEVGGVGDRSGFDGSEATIQLSQLIELGNKSQKRRKVASFEKELADLDYQNKRLEVFSEATKAFIGVLKAQDQLQLSNELLKLSEASFGTVEKRVQAGKDSPIEKIRASVTLSHRKMLHRRAQRDLEYARKELASFWRQDKPLFSQAAGNLGSIEPFLELENLTDRLKQTPAYTRWDAEIKKNRALLDLERSNAVGDITIGAGVQRFNETDDNAFVFGVSVPLPLSDRNQGGKQEAAYNLSKSRAEQRAAWSQLQNEFNRTYQEYADAYSQATALKNEVLPAATEMFNAATRAYRQGKVDYLNVQDAQRTLFDVKSEYIESIAACHAARTDIERFIGSQAQTADISESE